MAAVRGEVIVIDQLLYIVSEQAVEPIMADDWMIDVAVEPYVLEQWDGISALNATHKRVIATTNDDIAFNKIDTVLPSGDTSVTFDSVTRIDKIPQSFTFDYFGGENDDPDCPDCGDRVPQCTINEVDVETVDCVVTITIVSYYS